MQDAKEEEDDADGPGRNSSAPAPRFGSDRELHSAQKTPPHILQWCRLCNKEKAVLQLPLWHSATSSSGTQSGAREAWSSAAAAGGPPETRDEINGVAVLAAVAIIDGGSAVDGLLPATVRASTCEVTL